MLTAFRKNRDGATAIEYAFICALIVLVMVVGVSLLGQEHVKQMNSVSRKFNRATNQ